MLKRSNLLEYQVACVNFVHKIIKCGLFLDMGLGKTAITLTVISDFIDDLFCIDILIIAPLRVANTVWKQESQLWEHLRHLDIGICTGTASERNSVLKKHHRITIINRENTPWLCENHKWVWDMVVIDESTSFKSHKSQRFKHLRKYMKYVKSVILLTGTPAPNGYIDLWSQLFLIDSGERLGKNISMYRNRFFRASGYKGYDFKAIPGAEEEIRELIKDVCITLKSEDYIQLPERIDLKEYVIMPEKLRGQYDELEKEFILTLGSGEDIEAPSAAALHNKLLQFCNGAIYDEDSKFHEVHKLKLEALKEIMEDNPSENFLIVYNYKSDLERLKKFFPKMKVLGKEGIEVIDWNNGKIKMMAVHPASSSFGLNLQHGGSIIVWFGLNWSLELYQQMNKRLHRKGQTKPVRIIHLIMKDGIDEKVFKALMAKTKTQGELIEYLKFIYKI